MGQQGLQSWEGRDRGPTGEGTETQESMSWGWKAPEQGSWETWFQASC